MHNADHVAALRPTPCICALSHGNDLPSTRPPKTRPQARAAPQTQQALPHLHRQCSLVSEAQNGRGTAARSYLSTPPKPPSRRILLHHLRTYQCVKDFVGTQTLLWPKQHLRNGVDEQAARQLTRKGLVHSWQAIPAGTGRCTQRATAVARPCSPRARAPALRRMCRPPPVPTQLSETRVHGHLATAACRARIYWTHTHQA